MSPLKIPARFLLTAFVEMTGALPSQGRWAGQAIRDVPPDAGATQEGRWRRLHTGQGNVAWGATPDRGTAPGVTLDGSAVRLSKGQKKLIPAKRAPSPETRPGHPAGHALPRPFGRPLATATLLMAARAILAEVLFYTYW